MRTAKYERPVGASANIEFAFHFVAWAQQRREVAVKDLVSRYGMSRATAWRYLRAYNDVMRGASS
jgi:Fic family protein